CLAIGGWGDNVRFDEGVKTGLSRERLARNIASTVNRLGFDCVSEYPGGNSQDYKQVPNSRKTYEIKAFPKLLREIKKLLGNKELSIAVPGLKRDMVAYIPGEIPYINES
ncbi:chitinase, partial [Fusarium oxysporum f. sp. conglutinans race 2 54008]